MGIFSYIVKFFNSISNYIFGHAPSLMEIKEESSNHSSQNETEDLERYDLLGPDTIVYGTLNQSNEIFGSMRGTQCTSISIIALCMTQLNLIDDWDLDTVDTILELGNQLHSQSLDKFTRPIPDPPYLAVDEIDLGNIALLANINLQCVAVLTEVEMQGVLENDFHVVLLNFFESYEFGILTTQQRSFGIIQQNSRYWLFDPHSCGGFGEAREEGTATAYCGNSAEKLIEIMVQNLFSNILTQSPFTIVPNIFEEKSLSQEIISSGLKRKASQREVLARKKHRK